MSHHFAGLYNDTLSSTFFSSITHRTKKSEKFIKNLHAKRFTHLGYGLFDGAKTGYGVMRVGFDAAYANSNSSWEEMENWITTPIGLSTLACETLLVTILSGLANYWQKEDKYSDESTKKTQGHIAYGWPYFRDTLKGAKNGYRSVRSALSILESLSTIDLHVFLLPTGIALGSISIFNRVAARHVKDWRKDRENKYTHLMRNLDLFRIDEYHRICEDDIKKMNSLSSSNYVACAYTGVIDGLCLYTGAVSLASVSYSLFTVLSAFSGFYMLVCVATKLYEEYKEQQEFILKQLEFEQEICFHQWSSAYLKLQRAVNENATSVQALRANCHFARQQYYKKCNQLKKRLMISPTEAILAGLQDGINIYSVVGGTIFMISAISFILKVEFPSYLIISGVMSGVIYLMLGAAYRLHLRYIDNSQLEVPLEELDSSDHLECSSFNEDLKQQLIL